MSFSYNASNPLGRNYFFVALLLVATPAWSQKTGARPNVIIIITDDQGYGDFGFTGNPHVKTPNIDKLAAKSTRLVNYHVSPVCAPTRASLLTGRYHQRTGVHDTWNNGAILATEEITLAELLRGNGYKTGIVGKWHLGDNYPFRPSDQGFQYSYVHGGGGIGQPGDHISNFVRTDSSYFNSTFYQDNQVVKSKGYCTDVITDAGIRFIQNQKANPFFLYVSYNAPHTPLQLPQKYADLYKELKFDSPLDKEAGRPWADMSAQDKSDARKVYGMITNIDDNVGRILAEIENQKLENNTLIIFTTDNGNQQLRFNTGLKGLKTTVYEGGTRVPQLIYGKGFVPENKELNALLAHVDVLPTVLEATNTAIPKELHVDGFSYWTLLQGKTKVQERTFYNAWNRGWPEPYRNAAFYDGDYKLVAFNAEGNDLASFGLFNLRADPNELSNLVAEKPEIAKKLKEKLDATFADLSSSPQLSPRRIEVGTAFENPVVLTRQDWAGTALRNWQAENSLGTWTVRVKEEGNYSFKLINVKTISKGTRATVRLGQIQRSAVLREETDNVVVENIYLKKGDYDLETWLENGGNVTGPFYVEVTRQVIKK